MTSGAEMGKDLGKESMARSGSGDSGLDLHIPVMPALRSADSDGCVPSSGFDPAEQETPIMQAETSTPVFLRRVARIMHPSRLPANEADQNFPFPSNRDRRHTTRAQSTLR